jgi:hypothetical protein
VRRWGEELTIRVHQEWLAEYRKKRLPFYQDVARLFGLREVGRDIVEDPVTSTLKLWYAGGVKFLVRVADKDDEWDNPRLVRPVDHAGERFRDHLKHRYTPTGGTQ